MHFVVGSTISHKDGGGGQNLYKVPRVIYGDNQNTTSLTF